MNYAGIVTAVGAAICGLIAAYYWYKSSRVGFWPDWEFEPVIDEQKNMDRFAAIMKGTESSSRLNSLAAGWTAISVILNVASAIAGVWK
jgi:hypothetical protein